MKNAEEIPTPRTNALINKLAQLHPTHWPTQSLVNLTRQLERELVSAHQSGVLEGLRLASEIAIETGLQYSDYDPSRDGRVVGNATHDAILSLAEQIKSQGVK